MFALLDSSNGFPLSCKTSSLSKFLEGTTSGQQPFSLEEYLAD